VSLYAGVDAASCISARPKGQDPGSVRVPSDIRFCRANCYGSYSNVSSSGWRQTRLLSLNERTIAAANKNLEQVIESGDFREDLCYRLNVARWRCPCAIIAKTFPDLRCILPTSLRRSANAASKAFRRKRCTAHAIQLARQRSRTRERRRTRIALGLTDEILPEDLPEVMLEDQSSEVAAAALYHNTLNQTKKQRVVTEMDAAKGKQIEAARLLGIHPKYLHRLIKILNSKFELRRLG
jgi:transcriptional regulator with GAF, ATPase, and Fis domain